MNSAGIEPETCCAIDEFKFFFEGARWSSGQCTQYAIAEAKHRS
jgi:hypothetical protein